MVAKYKRKRLKEEQSLDMPPKQLKLEGSERGSAKAEIREELMDCSKCPFCPDPCGQEHCAYTDSNDILKLLDEGGQPDYSEAYHEYAPNHFVLREALPKDDPERIPPSKRGTK